MNKIALNFNIKRIVPHKILNNDDIPEEGFVNIFNSCNKIQFLFNFDSCFGG